MKLNKDYWERRYEENKLGWDIGKISSPLKEYIDQLKNKEIKILIPGAGNGYEVAYLVQNGFNNVYIADLARQPIENLQNRVPTLPANNFFYGDFFDLPNCKFDLILEQTFFCALHPKDREAYSLKMLELLKTGGKLVGLLFDFPLTEDGPPFGGSKEEYLEYFKSRFTINVLQRSYNSIPPRAGKELFFIFTK
ncbi:methyltransferase domain-containing protein [Eudoraea chungangensis]|uniref:methyltransferase domain-containing protein n=1 Tax=Eudoraea chungangensis TaxID=1481905 RepID=UPI0023EDD870|nr:methyltransferase domain-containing protein [Eudoraea chungangensis]